MMEIKYYLKFTMSNRHFLDEISRKIAEQMPEDPGSWGRDLRRNLTASVRSVLEKVDLVSREEFDIQRAVLRRTREKLEQLEKQVAELETLLKER